MFEKNTLIQYKLPLQKNPTKCQETTLRVPMGVLAGELTPVVMMIIISRKLHVTS